MSRMRPTPRFRSGTSRQARQQRNGHGMPVAGLALYGKSVDQGLEGKVLRTFGIVQQVPNTAPWCDERGPPYAALRSRAPRSHVEPRYVGHDIEECPRREQQAQQHGGNIVVN